MANRAYFSVWISGYSEDVMLDWFERFLETVPLSSRQPGFTSLLIRAVSPAEAPVAEHDLRSVVAGPAEIMALARELRHADSVYEVEGAWDTWQWDADTAAWQRQPAPLLLICNGATYEGGVAAREGHLVADIGFEYLLTGHAGLLGTRSAPGDFIPQHPLEEDFFALMSGAEHRQEYQEKTRANIQQLLTWIRAAEQALPVERYRLWSEGEVNLEGRLDEILALG